MGKSGKGRVSSLVKAPIHLKVSHEKRYPRECVSNEESLKKLLVYCLWSVIAGLDLESIGTQAEDIFGGRYAIISVQRGAAVQ